MRRSATTGADRDGAGGRPGDRVAPQRQVVVVTDRVVAEQIGIGEHHEAAVPELQGDRQWLVGRVGGRRRLRQHRGVRIGDREHARAVEARTRDAGQQIGFPSLARQLRAHPRHDVLVVVLGVLNGHVHRPDAEPLEQAHQVVAVLVLLALRQHDQPAAVADERLQSVDLLRRQNRRPDTGDPFPGAVGRMRHDHDVAIRQRGCRQRSRGVRVDPHAAFAQRGRSLEIAGIARVPRVHLRDRLGPDAPRLAMGLVEQNARKCPMGAGNGG